MGEGPLPPSVLFVCNLNRVRSPMAAALMRRRHGEAIVDSCGLEPADTIDPFVAGVLYELGVDIADHEPKALESVDLTAFDLVIALTPESLQQARDVCAGRVEYWPTSDPTTTEGSRDQRIEAYRLTRSELDQKLAERFG